MKVVEVQSSEIVRILLLVSVQIDTHAPLDALTHTPVFDYVPFAFVSDSLRRDSLEKETKLSSRRKKS